MNKHKDKPNNCIHDYSIVSAFLSPFITGLFIDLVFENKPLPGTFIKDRYVDMN